MTLDSVIMAMVTPLLTVVAAYFVLIKPSKDKEAENKSPKGKVPSKEEIEKLGQKKEKILEEAKVRAEKIIQDAKVEAYKTKQDAEKDFKERSQKLLELDQKNQKRLDEIYSKLKEAEKKERNAQSMQSKFQNKVKEIENIRQKQINKLESIASLTKSEAKKLMLDNLEKTLEDEVARKIKEKEEKIQLEADKKAQEILADAMQHASTDFVPEYTISTVKLRDHDMKGRIIGKEGRNIKAFEDLTGVNVDFEENDEIRLSSFDAVRREVARLSMEKLIKDGRIQPARIEEVVKKTQKEVDKLLLQSGEDLCQRVGVYNLPKELVQKLGHYRYRTSYGQSLIQHTLEDTKMAVKIAHELKANVAIVKLASLLHDIGKVITDKEGSHTELGSEYLKKFNLPKPVIAAVSEHHEDKPSSLEGVIVQIADSISGSRPGARYEDFENYVRRMKNLEEAAMSFRGVEKAYAISAGRELRVIVKPQDITDSQAVKLSHDIAKKIQEQETFPGTVNVIVVRETRASSTAV